MKFFQIFTILGKKMCIFKKSQPKEDSDLLHNKNLNTTLDFHREVQNYYDEGSIMKQTGYAKKDNNSVEIKKEEEKDEDKKEEMKRDNRNMTWERRGKNSMQRKERYNNLKK